MDRCDKCETNELRARYARQDADHMYERLKNDRVLILDDYEIANLRAFMDAFPEGNTGDWYHQILNQLPGVSTQPNVSSEELRARVNGGPK